MGLVLVFDLDQTIIDSSDPFLFNRPNTPDGIRELKFRVKGLLNFKLVNDVIKRAVKLRGKKDASGNDVLSGIFLLTNNSSKIMVSAVDSVLLDEVRANNPENPIIAEGKYMTPHNADPDIEGMPQQTYFFDSIMMREHKMRTPSKVPNNPVKNLDDVKHMLGFIGIDMSADDIKRNTFFFDDMNHPEMTLGSQYITIVPPFEKYSLDYTYYTPVLRKLSELDGQPMVRPPRGFTPALTVSRTPVIPEVVVKQRTIGRNRSNTKNEGAGNNMELPLTKQEAAVRAARELAKPPNSSGQSQYRPRPGESMKNFMIRMGENTSGGRRKSRTRKNGRNKSRKRLRQ